MTASENARKLMPETLRKRAALLRADTMGGLVSIAAHLDLHADAWETENARLREESRDLERRFQALADSWEFERQENARLAKRIAALVTVARHVNREFKSTLLAEAIDATLAAAEEGTNAHLP